jgi:Domain of unknown function (DUF4169)
MGDIVNLNRYRKGKKARDEKRAAATSRAKFGRNKAELLELKSARERAERTLDAKLIEPDAELED